MVAEAGSCALLGIVCRNWGAVEKWVPCCETIRSSFPGRARRIRKAALRLVLRSPGLSYFEKYLSAYFINVGQLGPTVWPAEC